MQLNKTLCLIFLLVSLRDYSQEVKKIEYLFLSRTCDTLYSITEGSDRASFYVYGAGYHIKAKRDSLADAQMKRRRDFPNVILSGPEPWTGSSYWAMAKRNVPTIDGLPYITVEEYYKNSLIYYLLSRLFFIVPKKDGTFDIWESGQMGQE